MIKAALNRLNNQLSLDVTALFLLVFIPTAFNYMVGSLYRHGLMWSITKGDECPHSFWNSLTENNEFINI